jgi:hypothetical protein
VRRYRCQRRRSQAQRERAGEDLELHGDTSS